MYGEELERSFREREILVKERDQATREAELDLKRRDQATSGWRSPLVVAVLAAALGASGNAVVTYVNGDLQRQLEAQRAEQARLLEMIKTGDADKAAENLRFLLDAGLVNDDRQAGKLREFLANRKPGSGPTLPSPASIGPYTGGIIGVDDAISINALPAVSPIRQAAGAVGQLRVVDSNQRPSAVCTAFLVSTTAVLTTDFCAKNLGSAASFVLNISGSESKFDVELPAMETDANLGYAMLRLSTVVSSVSPLRLSDRPPAANEGLAMVMFRAREQQLTVAGAADCRVVSVEADRFNHQCDSGGGSSGAPLFSAGGATVLGIHSRREQGQGVAVRADMVLRTSDHLR